MYQKSQSTLTPSGSQTVRHSVARSTSRDSPIHCLFKIIWCVYSECFK